jgi:hypothetical protein
MTSSDLAASPATADPSSQVGTLSLSRDAFGRLVLTTPDGHTHAGVTPVRAFPLSAPEEGLSLVGPDGHELAWLGRLADLPEPDRSLVSEELTARELMPLILRLLDVSTFATPSTWTVDTDRGRTELVLKGEDDIRRLGGGRLLVTSAHGLAFVVPDMAALDPASRKLLERFL